jgi:hypothetical protein
MNEWQCIWNGTSKEIWTRTLIPDIRAWAERGMGGKKARRVKLPPDSGAFRSRVLCIIFTEDRKARNRHLLVL